MDDQDEFPVQPQNPLPDYPSRPRAEIPVPPAEFEPATTGDQSPGSGLPAPVPPSTANPGGTAYQPHNAKRKKWPIFAASAAAVVLLGASSALAYTYYQNPDRVIMDGFSKALQAKSIAFTSIVNVTNLGEAASVKLDIKGATDGKKADLDVAALIKQDDQQYQLQGKGVFDENGILYIRLQDIGKTVNAFLGSNPGTALPEGMKPLIGKLAEKLNDRWIKIRPSDIKGYSSQGADTLTCLKEASAMLRNGQDARRELATLYLKNPFINVDEKLGTKNGSLGYVISPDETKQKAFWEGMKNTAVYKKFQACGGDADADQKDPGTDGVKNQHTEIWLSQWQHEITQVKVRTEGKDGAIADLSWLPTFNRPVTIDVPDDVTTLSELQADIQNAVFQYMTTQVGVMSQPGSGQKL